MINNNIFEVLINYVNIFPVNELIYKVKNPPSLENLIEINSCFKMKIKTKDRNIFCSYNECPKYIYDLYSEIEEVKISNCSILNIPYDKINGRIKYLTEKEIEKLQEYVEGGKNIFITDLSEKEKVILKNPTKNNPNIIRINNLIIIYPGDHYNSRIYIGPVINDEEKIYLAFSAPPQERYYLDFFKKFF